MQQQPKITMPLDKNIFQQIPDEFRKSFVSIGNASPVAEESPHLKTEKKEFGDF